MLRAIRPPIAVTCLFILLALVSSGYAQKKKAAKPVPKSKAVKAAKPVPKGNAVMWERVNISQRDLFDGPGGDAMRPNLSSIKFIEEEKGGHNKKFLISDGSGRIWVAKLGREAQPETAAVRLLWALGYKTEINYLVPTLTIPGKGTFQNVRLEARPEHVKRLDPWKWRDNPFVGTNELQGLKIMMVFLTNWDLLDMQNKVLKVKDGNDTELQYIISDLGATFGRLGNNNIPIFYRFGRKTNNPRAWSKAKFIKGVKNGQLRLASTGQKSFGLMKGITVEQGRWLADLLVQLSDRQIEDMFRAANYAPADIDILTKATKRRINELTNVRGERNLAGK